MNIDWFTFVAQIVNFLILVALLRKFLYRPILRAMEKREERVTSRLEDARAKEEEADRKAQEYEEKSQEIEQRREQLLKEARDDADEERDRLITQVRGEVDRKREEWHNSLEREQMDILSEVSRLAGDMGIEAARRVLQQLADAELESRIFTSFAKRLRDLDDDEQKRLRERLKEPDTIATVRSAFDVSDDAATQVRDALREHFDYDRDITFETDADLICGLELDADGRTYGWNIRQFLGDLDDEVEQRLRGGQHREAGPDTMQQADGDLAPSGESNPTNAWTGNESQS